MDVGGGHEEACNGKPGAQERRKKETAGSAISGRPHLEGPEDFLGGHLKVGLLKQLAAGRKRKQMATI